MTVVLNPFLPRPIPPSPPAPAPAAPGNRVVPTRFGDLLRDLHAQNEPSVFLGDAVSHEPGDQTQANVGADIFNEHGLFQGATSNAAAQWLPERDQVAADAEAAIEASSVAGPSIAGSGTPPASTLAREATDMHVVGLSRPGQPEVVVSGQGQVTDAAALAARGLVARTPGGAVVVPRSRLPQVNDGAPARIGPSRSRLWALLSRQGAREGAGPNPQLSVQAVEQGLRVVARLDALDRTERVRLRDRIAGLLSRHGFVGREIDVTGHGPTEEESQTCR
ncbi:MAG: hypothetical protein WC729_11320 [Sphingomonas sp.]|jgi:hypothetical protein|uniref:hypothetical protein n=1 Tax=Sphingomonas sp. TaxID=28214 RepID=UPI00356731C4